MTFVYRKSADAMLRLESEYREMPGLCLTPQQAARLLQIEPARCADALDDLARSGFLRRLGDRYLRTDGRV